MAMVFRDWDFQSPEYFPTLKFVERLKESISNHAGNLESFNFSGLQVLTDEAFFGLQTLHSDKRFRLSIEKVVDIDLSGCVHVTDKALTVIGTCFPFLKKLKLDGCRNVTEQGLLSVVTEELELSTVGCCRIRVPLSCLTDRQDPSSLSGAIKPEIASRKVVILSETLWRYSLIRYLSGQKQIAKDSCEDVLFKRMSSQPATEDGTTLEKSKDVLHFNVFETHTFNNLTAPVLTEKALYVLVFPCGKDLLLNVMTAMNAVKGLEPDPEFIIVLLHNSATRLDKEHNGVGIEKIIKERLEIQNTALTNQIEEEVFDSKMVENRDFQAQQRISRAMALKDRSLESVKFSIYRLNLDTDMVEVQYQSATTSAKNNETSRKRELAKLKETLESKIEEFVPVYERACSSLQNLNKNDITEIRSFAKPPPAVLQVVEGLLLIFKMKNTSWASAKRFLSDINIIGKLIDYDLDAALTPKIVKDLSEYMLRVDITHDKIRSISSACSSFWLWISAVHQYSSDVLPIRQQYKMLEDSKQSKDEEPNEGNNMIQEKNQEALYKKQEQLKKQLEEQQAMKVQLSEVLRTMKKSDLYEVKQFKNPPEVVSEVMGSLAIVLNIKPKKPGDYWSAMQQLISKADFMKTLMEFDPELSQMTMKRLHIFLDNSRLTEEKVHKVSKICVSLWRWVNAVYDYNKKVQPIQESIAQTELEIKEHEAHVENNVISEKGPDMLWRHLERTGHSLSDREPVLRPQAWTEQVQQVWTVLQQLKDKGTKACFWSTIEEIMNDNFNDQQLSVSLEIFHYQGHIVYYPDLEGRAVILDVEWYCKCLNDTLVSMCGQNNKQRCVALPGRMPLFIKQNLYKLWDCLTNETEGDLLLSVLKHTGVVLDVPRLAEDEHRNKELMFVHKNLEAKPAMRTKTGEDHVSYADFKSAVWPTKKRSSYLEGDLSVTYKYVLNYGIPPALFSQFLAECIRMGQVIHIWSVGFIVRCGAVDIIIQQQVHAFNLTSSIDLNARTNGILEGASCHILQDYIWSILNPYLLLMDYLIECYRLSVRVRIPCLGGCSNTELGHYFSSVELKQQHEYQLHCTLCGDQQMSLDTCGYLKGKRGVLPLHDFMDPEEKDIQIGENSPYGLMWNRDNVVSEDQLMWVCGHCGISKHAANHLWKMQCKVYPIPDSLALGHSHKDGYSLYHTKGVPLYLLGLLDLHVTLIKYTQVKFIVARDEYLTGNIVFKDLTEYRQARLVYDFKTGVIEQIAEVVNKQKDSHTIGCINVGDTFTVEATASKLVDMSSIDETWVMIELSFKKNGRVIHTTNVPYRSFIGVLVESPSKQHSVAEGVVIECPTFPYVQANHFPLGQAVYYKTGLGNQWALAQVYCTEQGQVTLKGETGALLTPKPEDILPVALYSDITVTIGGEVLRNKEHIVQYLLAKKWNAVTYGLFTHLYQRRGTYSTVYLRRHHMPKQCTWKGNSAAALEQLFNKYINSEAKAGKFVPPEHHVLLPHGLTQGLLIHAPRQVIQNWTQQNVYFLCKGTQWVTYGSHYRDTHLLSTGAALESAANICTKLRNCHKSDKQKKDQDKKDKEDDADSDIGETGPDNKVHLHAGDHMQLVIAYHFMIKNKNCLPDIQKRSLIFTEDKTEQMLSENEMAGLYRMMSMYKDTFLLLDRILEVAYQYDFTKLHSGYRLYNRYLLNLNKAMNQGDQKKTTKTCKAHDILGKKSNFSAVSTEDMTITDPFGFETKLDGYTACITFVNLTGVGPIGKFLKQFLRFLPNIRGLALLKCNIRSIEGIEQCRRLVFLDVSSNHIPVISTESLLPLSNTLEVLNISSNPITDFPSVITKLTKLRQLLIGDTLITQLPEEIGELKHLRVLNLKVTLVSELPSSIIKCKMIHFLNLQGVPWLGRYDNVSTFDQWKKWAEGFVPTKNLPLKEMFDKANVTRDMILDEDEQDLLNEKLISIFPRIGRNAPEDDKYGGIPKEIFSLRNLRTLALGGQLIHKIPDQVSKLRRLQHLLLFYNPNLQGISGQLGKANLQTLSLGGCPKCKTPPQEIIEKGMKVVLAYLKKLAQGSAACNRTKLMFVGLGGAGKTSLTRALMSSDHKAPVLNTEAITDGIDISTWSIKRDQTMLQYSVWDFAGQTVYYNTHQFFLSNRALYLLVWNTRLGYEHSGLDFWLRSIACHCPRAPVFVVGTHADQITKTELPRDALKKKHPKIAGFFTVSSTSGLGVRELYERIVEVTLEQPYMGEMIPESWLSYERVLVQKRGNESLLDWDDLMVQAHKVGIYGDEVLQSVRFLHELGTLQHFENDFLKDKVVINPQWIIDVMACVVSVHNKVIVDGHLNHKDISVIWKNYPEKIHEWLLRLTEVFDLTFPLNEKAVSVVPCLLPQEAPEYHWPKLGELEGAKETKIVYTFDYLPSGLCNRAQVRLCQFSDTSNMWKMGSVLVKNGHYALIQQISATRVLVKVIGQRPENILLLIHEVFESLIADFFQGVKYEYQIPCPDCIEVHIEDPTMFSSKVLRKAIEMKALFLQCHCLFHTLSIADVQGVMPPQSGNDYALQLDNAMRELDDLEGVIGTDLFFMFCESDLPQAEEEVVDIRQVKADLEKRDIKCWFTEKLRELQIEQLAVAMKNSKLVLVFISDDFVLDEGCKRMFKFAKESLRKDMQLVMVGKGREWMKSEFIGIQVTDEVFVNLQRVHQYSTRFEELFGRIQQKLGKALRPSEDHFDVFLSYAWTNSEMAIKVGQASQKEGSLGHGDPRAIKDFLQQHGISVWIDVEQVGRMGLYEDIAAGLKQSKIMVACISDEYALSNNCQIEFRFANTSLKKPIILAVVGTGFMWQSTEIGMLSLGYPKINFQVTNNLSHEQLLRYVQEALDSVEDDPALSRPLTPSSLSQKEMAFQELFEMAQRKFLRQISSYVKNSDPYPRLFVADMNYDPIETVEEGEVSLEDTELLVDEDSDQKASFVVDDLRSGQFCIKALCEYEGGWHSVDEGLLIDLAGRDLYTMWKFISPYMARVLAILKHSNINLHIIHSSEGEKLQNNLEQMMSTEMQRVDLRPIYLALRSYVVQKDTENNKGNLKMCYLPSGKTLWLCEEHQKQPRITVLEIPEIISLPVKDNAEVTLMSALEALFQKEVEELPTDQGELVKPPSHAARHTRFKSGKLSQPTSRPELGLKTPMLRCVNQAVLSSSMANQSTNQVPSTPAQIQATPRVPSTLAQILATAKVPSTPEQNQATAKGTHSEATGDGPSTKKLSLSDSPLSTSQQAASSPKDRKALWRKATAINAMMGTGTVRTGDGPSQACVIL